MRCLLCGNSLSVLQKLTDADFCSAEHRGQFFLEQQRLILQRLQESAARLQSLNRHQSAPAKRPAPAAEAPTPVAGFLLHHPDPLSRHFGPVAIGPLECIEAPALPLALTAGGSIAAFESPFFPSFPWPKYNPGLWFFDYIEPEHSMEQLENAVRVLGAWNPLATAWSAGRLLPVRRPDLRAPRRGIVKGTPVWAWADEAPQPEAGNRLSSAPTLRAGLGRFQRPRMAKPNLNRCSPQIVQIRTQFLTVRPEVLLPEGSQADSLSSAVRFLDRFYRIRPRGAVSNNVALKPVTVEPISIVLAPAYLLRQRGLVAEPASAAFAPGAPAPAGDRSPGAQGLRGGPEVLRGSVSLPSAASAGEPQLPSAVRAFRMRPRAGVTDTDLPYYVAVPLDALGFVEGHALRPGSTGLADPQPPQSDRMYRPKPGRPAPSGAKEDHRAPSVPLLASIATHWPSFSHTASQLELTSIKRLFRSRLRSHVDSGSSSVLFDGALAPQAIQTRPLAPALVVGQCQPRIFERFFRPRPRGPVSCEDLRQSEFVEPAGIAFEATQWYPASVAVAQESELPAVSALFRMRPRSGVADPRIRGLAAMSPPAETAASQPVTPEIPLSGCEPQAVQRFFRPRPRGPVASGQAAALESITPEQSAFKGKCCDPASEHHAPELEPRAAQRLYRAKPGRAVADSRLTELANVSLQAEPLASCPVAPHPGVTECLPGKLDRFFRPRPRGPVAREEIAESQPITVEESGFKGARCDPTCVASAPELEPRAAQRLYRSRPGTGATDPRISGLANTSLRDEPLNSRPVAPHPSITECLPGKLDRFFRPRPRGPVARVELAAFEQISADQGAFGSRPCNPAADATSQELQPRLEQRFYRSRPAAPAGSPFGGLAAGSLRSEVLQGHPVVPHPDVTECRPGKLDRFFRPRPRGPVTFDGVAVSEAIQAEELLFAGATVFEPSQAQPVTPAIHLGGSVPGSIALFPARIERFFRMRPNRGVADLRIDGLHDTQVAVERFQSEPAYPWIDVLACEVSSAVRFFRPRARGPVSCQMVMHVSPGAATATSFTALCARPGLIAPVTELEPPSLFRFFRYRPRAGVGSSGLASFQAIETLAVPVGLKPVAMCQPLGECVPRQNTRLFRPRPRAAADSVMGVENVPATATSFGGAISYATFGLGAFGQPSPDFLNRLYRTKPRPPIQDPETMAQPIRSRHLPATDPDPILASMPAETVVQKRPNWLGKLYRMRPRGGKDSQNGPRQIPAVPEASDALSQGSAKDPQEASRELLRSVTRQWKILPLDLKAMAMMLPLILVLALQPRATDGQVRTAGLGPSASPETRTLVSTQVSSWKQALRARAAIDIREDFRSGLHSWTGGENWGATWQYHPSGSVQPGKLALFTPSLKLINYRLDFTAQIVRKAVSWIVRATDENNYVAVRLVTTDDGPVPKLTVERYAVVNGKPGQKIRVPLAVAASRETLFRIALEVRDQYFTLMIQDKVVDFWSDEQLKSGGIGLFSGKAEQALIQSVRLSHQQDAIGRICAALFLQD